MSDKTEQAKLDVAELWRKDVEELKALRARCERLQRDLNDPPADIQELVIKKLNLVSGEALAAAQAKCERLEGELASIKKAWSIGRGRVIANFSHVPEAVRVVDWIEYEMQKVINATDCGKAILSRLEEARRLLGQETPWPLAEVLRAAGEAIDHLFQHHDCDHHGWERFKEVRDRLKDYEAKATQWLKGGQP